MIGTCVVNAIPPIPLDAAVVSIVAVTPGLRVNEPPLTPMIDPPVIENVPPVMLYALLPTTKTPVPDVASDPVPPNEPVPARASWLAAAIVRLPAFEIPAIEFGTKQPVTATAVPAGMETVSPGAVSPG